MLELVTFPMVLIIGFVVQLHSFVGPVGLALLVLAAWGWTRC